MISQIVFNIPYIPADFNKLPLFLDSKTAGCFASTSPNVIASENFISNCSPFLDLYFTGMISFILLFVSSKSVFILMELITPL